jgi:ATP-dependent helicase HepA
MPALVIGMKVRYVPQPEWGIGHLMALEENGTRAQVLFPARQGGPVFVSTRNNALQPTVLKAGDLAVTSKAVKVTITGEVEGGRGLRRYTFKGDDGEEDELPESELHALPPRPDSLSLLREGRVADARNFLLRRTALVLDDERRCDALGALLASRVMVKPHQVGVVQRVLTAHRPRFVLADEVGLGKTIEAGMIFSALRLSGLARRVLVVAPSHLTVQWLVELFHKFNHLFTLMDAERHEKSLEAVPETSPWARFDFVVTSLELLQRNEQFAKEAGSADARWDLVIIDEAHHLKGAKAYAAAKALAKNTWGLLLLTATPMQLDPEEYHALLSLIDEQAAPSAKDFVERLKRQDALSGAVRELLEGKKTREALKALASKFPGDEVLKGERPHEEVLEHLAETYSLSDKLVRNRRAEVGGFSARKLHRHPVKQTKEEKDAREEALETLAKHGGVKGAALSGLLRRLESSPAAFLAATETTKALAGTRVTLPTRDGKYQAFAGVLEGIWAKEKTAKVLVFTESRETLEAVQLRLREDGVEALAYHGDLPLVERDRQVARFRDPDGPRVLLCTEVGGEGRNFQFSHHLVNYDLPWSPAVMEQRIGRLDRIGQSKPVDIHVFEVPGTLSADVLELLDGAVGVFGETVGGLDAVLEEVEPRLTELALAKPKERAAYVKELAAAVTRAREQVKKAYDPLLDLRSFDKEAVKALVERAQTRSGIEPDDEDETLEDGLWSVARDLDERLEETVTELALKVGLGVDTDQQVDAFQCALHFGHALNVEALPGIDITKERTVLGTFWRDTAVEQEEIEYFATGHPIVEALFGFLRDGPFGRNGARYFEVRGPLKHRGIELVFHLVPPEAEDTSAGARVPSRQLARFLESLFIHVAVSRSVENGRIKSTPDLLEVLKQQEGRSLKGDELRLAFPELPKSLDELVQVGAEAAKLEAQKRAARAKKAIEAERDRALKRLKLGLEHQGVDTKKAQGVLAQETAHYQALLDALGKCEISLDSVCAFVINR